MSKTYVCRFSKFDKCVVTWFSFGSLQLLSVVITGIDGAFIYVQPKCIFHFYRLTLNINYKKP